MRVQAPQALRGVGGGLQAGDRVVEGITSWLLGLQATSSPALAIQTLGDVLEVPSTGEEGQVATHWPPSSWAAPALCSSRNLGSRGARTAGGPPAPLALPTPSPPPGSPEGPVPSLPS